jgi:hypothetical protein
MTTLLYLVMVAAALAGLAVVLAGWGLLFTRMFDREDIATRDIVVAPWLGWCLVLALLQIWHLFLAITPLVLLPTFGVGIAGWWISVPRLRSWASNRGPSILAFVAILGALAWWMALHSTCQPGIFDSGLYHLNAIRWANTYPAVPGLVNLHGRLGFNCSFFLYAAMLNAGPFVHRCHHLATGALFLMSFVPCLWGWQALFRSGVAARAEHLYYAFFSAPLAVWAVNSDNATSPTPDVAVFLIGIVVGGELIQLLQPAADHGLPAMRSDAAAYRVLAVLLLAVAGLTVKLNFMGLGGTAALLACASFVSRSEWRVAGRKLLARTVIVGLLLAVPWMARGIILSGYVAYPLGIGSLPVDWKASTGQAAVDAGWIKSWARLPYVNYQQVLASWDWIRPWSLELVRQHRFDVVLPLLVTAAMLALAFCLGLRAGKSGPRASWLFLTVPAGGLIFWFFTAPDPRFAGACFWMMAIGAVLTLRPWVRADFWRPAALLLVGGSWVLHASRGDFRGGPPRDIGPARTVLMKIMCTDSGLRVYVPYDDHQNRCWDAPLPCAPKFRADLRLRDPEDMSKGFTFQPPANHGGVP